MKYLLSFTHAQYMCEQATNSETNTTENKLKAIGLVLYIVRNKSSFISHNKGDEIVYDHPRRVQTVSNTIHEDSKSTIRTCNACTYQLPDLSLWAHTGQNKPFAREAVAG